MQRISEHISYNEAVRSITARRNGIDNKPGQEQLTRMIMLANNVFERVRKHFKVPIFIHSFFRCPELNSKIGGASKSQHMAMDGAAIDIDGQVLGEVSNKEIFDFIKDHCAFDKLIWEFGDDNEPDWVHVSYRDGNNRFQILKAKKIDGITQYIRL